MKNNLTAVLNLQRPDKKGEYPVRLRTTIEGKVTYYPAGIMLKQHQLVDGIIVNHPSQDLLNAALRKKMLDIQTELIQSDILGQDVKQLKKINNITFNEFAEKKLKDQTGVLAPGTLLGKYTVLAKFNEFSPGIKLRDVNQDVMRRFENWCRDQGNNGNTIWNSTKFIKNILNLAVADKIFSVSPGKGFSGSKYVDPFRDTLSAREIKLIEDFANNKKNSKTLLNVANWFIFSCYCGLRYGDMKRFKGFSNGKILIQTEKTDEVVSIYATPQIIEAYERISMDIFSNQSVSVYLKIICSAVGIEKDITFHSARHTFAVQFLIRGGRLEILSKIMGHSKISTTAIYAKISNNLADDEMKKVWGAAPEEKKIKKSRDQSA